MPYTEADLEKSHLMDPVHGTVDIDVPIDVLWEAFTHANYWPRWNKCFFWAKNRSLVAGRQLVWCFEPIRWWYPYKMWAIAKIVEVQEKKKVTWEVTALPGFYARHTYFMEGLGDGRSRFGSHEKAMGWGFRLMRWFWVTHFRFVKDRSLEGARELERVYKQTGALRPETLKPKRYWPFFLSLLLLAGLLGAAGFAAWFYLSFMRLTSTELAPGVHAVFGGGGNSLVVQDGKDVLLVDTKFPPGSRALHDWLDANVRPPVTKVINTHYHYDHTQGNVLYPDARIYAHRRAKQLMKERDGDWWADRGSGLPVETFHDGEQTLLVGSTEVVVTHTGAGHTEGDVWLYLPKHNIFMTGDLVFHTYYPLFDPGEGGADIAPMARIVRELADKHPDARFLPGHGPLATAADLLRYADYLEHLDSEVKKARAKGLSEDQAAKEIDLSDWRLKRLPSFPPHSPYLEVSSAGHDIRWAYQVQERRKE
jgi:glyoxylase-like metal-dependent hydrolase (beta-lactamase superfamily II)